MQKKREKKFVDEPGVNAMHNSFGRVSVSRHFVHYIFEIAFNEIWLRTKAFGFHRIHPLHGACAWHRHSCEIVINVVLKLCDSFDIVFIS